MKYLFLCLLLSSCLLLPAFGYIHNHSFVFISGWPQSGTSLVHQVLSFNPDMSSVIELCEKILGKRCISWNHESQWIFPGNIREHIHSGDMCPIQNVKEDIGLAMQQQVICTLYRWCYCNNNFLVASAILGFRKTFPDRKIAPIHGKDAHVKICI
jgi:hypothetical protein